MDYRVAGTKACCISGSSEPAEEAVVNDAPAMFAKVDEKIRVFNRMFNSANFLNPRRVLLADWSDPDPETSFFPWGNVGDYMMFANLGQGKEADLWLAAVRRRMGDKEDIPGVLQAVVGAMEEFGISYHPAQGVMVGQSYDITINLNSPSEMLQSRGGECRTTSLLVVATLERLGFKAVAIVTRAHVVAAAVSSAPELGHLKGIPLPSPDNTAPRRYLYPINALFLKGEPYDFDEAFRGGTEFTAGALKKEGNLVVDIKGNILYRGPRRSEFYLGKPITGPLGNKDDNSRGTRPNGGGHILVRPDLGW